MKIEITFNANKPMKSGGITLLFDGSALRLLCEMKTTRKQENKERKR
jgi:hypothetical protein